MATTTTTATEKEKPLRRRMRVLDRTHSLSSLGGLASNDAKILPFPDIKHKPVVEQGSPLSPTDYESHGSHSDSSDDEGPLDEEQSEEEPERIPDVDTRPHRPSVSTQNLPPHHSHVDHSPTSPKSGAWYEFDLAVVVALVSPIGNWLTGGDHVKNILLIVLLIFYLHQIIEIPWALYQKSRPRRGADQIPSPHPDSSEARYARLAVTELRKLEYLFLFLTFISPMLGATLLRYASAAVLGPDAVSWFSTGLFVLATGMRPWAHLIERLNQRTDALHDFIHYPTLALTTSDEKHRLLEKRVAQLEKALNKVTSKTVHATEDVYDYVDDAIDAVEHAMRKQERKWNTCNSKVKEVEEVVVALKSSRQVREIDIGATVVANLSAVTECVHSVLTHILPRWLIAQPPKRDLYHGLYANSAASSNGAAFAPRHPRRPSSSSSSPSQSITPLETIHEEGSMSKLDEFAWLSEPSWITSNIVYRVGYVLTLPLRAVARMVLRNY